MKALGYLLGARAIDVADAARSIGVPGANRPFLPIASTPDRASAWRRWAAEGRAAGRERRAGRAARGNRPARRRRLARPGWGRRRLSGRASATSPTRARCRAHPARHLPRSDRFALTISRPRVVPSAAWGRGRVRSRWAGTKSWPGSTTLATAPAAARPMLVLVRGEAGIGKSRLVADAIERARAAGSLPSSTAPAWTWTARACRTCRSSRRCGTSSGRRPASGSVELLGPAMADLRRSSRRWRRSPARPRRRPPGPRHPAAASTDPPESSGDRARLFERFLGVFGRIGRRRARARGRRRRPVDRSRDARSDHVPRPQHDHRARRRDPDLPHRRPAAGPPVARVAGGARPCARGDPHRSRTARRVATSSASSRRSPTSRSRSSCSARSGSAPAAIRCSPRSSSPPPARPPRRTRSRPRSSTSC